MSVPFALVRDQPSEDEQALYGAERSRARQRQTIGQTGTAYPTDALWDALREVNDPEMPISVVDMGLIVALERQDSIVSVKLTLTAMGCPAMDMIMDDIRSRLLQEPGVEKVEIEIVWEPLWTPARMTEEGRDTLRMWGIGIGI
ncbi:MAG TPA: metal-sulfur cluster assembly factor [Ktedonobacterales bacterium]